MSEGQQYSLPLDPPRERPVELLAAHEVFVRADNALVDRLVENSVVEKKNGRIKPSVLSEYFSMWANTGPFGGLILIGVENDGRKTGLLSYSTREIADIELAGANLCPDARFEAKRINIINVCGDEDFILISLLKTRFLISP